jgi:hypothetical protein
MRVAFRDKGSIWDQGSMLPWDVNATLIDPCYPRSWCYHDLGLVSCRDEWSRLVSRRVVSSRVETSGLVSCRDEWSRLMSRREVSDGLVSRPAETNPVRTEWSDVGWMRSRYHISTDLDHSSTSIDTCDSILWLSLSAHVIHQLTVSSGYRSTC